MKKKILKTILVFIFSWALYSGTFYLIGLIFKWNTFSGWFNVLSWGFISAICDNFGPVGGKYVNMGLEKCGQAIKKLF